ncbi:MAG TPA: Holliday junction branch migration protein RuvA [Rhodothermales bacterium]|nr:Holliday junction branch migration protein RuvA [Rhodothermales bacterium]
MIHHLNGTLVEKKPSHAIVECGGVGYFVGTPASTYEALPAEGHPCHLLTVFVVREDGMQLFGFATRAEREVFEALTSVSGVGPRMALAALSAMRPAELQSRILAADAALLTNIPGIGRKTAERMVVDLRDRMARLDVGGDGVLGGGGSVSEARADALAALEALGFARAVAERKLRLVLRSHPGTQNADELVRLALREQG